MAVYDSNNNYLSIIISLIHNETLFQNYICSNLFKGKIYILHEGQTGHTDQIHTSGTERDHFTALSLVSWLTEIQY